MSGARCDSLKFSTGKIDCQLKCLQRVNSHDRADRGLRSKRDAHGAAPISTVDNHYILLRLSKLHAQWMLALGTATNEKPFGHRAREVARCWRKRRGFHVLGK